MAAVYEMPEGLHAVGILPARMLREFDALCLMPMLALSVSVQEPQERRQELENDTHE